MVKKETFKSRMTAEAFYNELWQIDNEIKEYENKLKILYRRKDDLNKISRTTLK